ncbi:MAG TPA: SAM-dependent chlorinase/fluorinase [Bacteroidota bacterium]|nr:SAM-dependent chlorinase/fluorinase [Bacteroidota bacterium]
MSLIALLTDFGLSDHYVGTMKGVIVSANPGARIIDLSHDVRPQQVHEAGYLLWAAYTYFPKGTIFVCVVDPGVGSTRRILAVETEHYRFLTPDNGLLDYVLAEERIIAAREVVVTANGVKGLPRVRIERISSTFHGRDIFAPVAAALSRGDQWTGEAPLLSLKTPDSVFVDSHRGKVQPRILHIDRFGNLITNIRSSNFYEAKTLAPALRVGKKRVRRWISNYSEGSLREPSLILGSSSLIEVVLREGSAARHLRASLATKLAIVRS